ncbi:MAG: hypothetical protein Q9195_009513 [Heterodermia aff. obscurata]
MEAVSNELGMAKLHQSEKGAQQQYRMRVPWRFPEFTDPEIAKIAEDGPGHILAVEWDPQMLSAYLFALYLTMFASENPSNLMARFQRMIVTSQYSTNMQRYTRAAMAALLRIVKVGGITNWDKTMDLFTEMIEDDRTLLIGSNGVQELYLYLHCFGVWSSGALQRGPNQLTEIPGLSLKFRPGETGLLAEESLSALVHLVLVVPRKSLKVITSEDPDTLGSPALQISITQDAPEYAFDNHFSSIHCSFGKLASDNGIAHQEEIEEDDDGWMGSADLIVTCQVPAFVLLTGPREGISVAMTFMNSPEASMKFSLKTGLRLQIFVAKLRDSQRVKICRNAPGLRSQDAIMVQNQWIEATSKSEKLTSRSLVTLDSNHVAVSLQQHIDFPPGSAESKALVAGKSVTVVQKSSCTVTLQIGDPISRPIYFPFHINGSQSRLRVAQKSSWIEVSLPIHTAPSREPFESWMQLLFPKRCPPQLWSIPKINLALQPAVSFVPGKSKDASWISYILGSTLSATEITLSGDNNSSDISASTAKHELKESLQIMIVNFAGLKTTAKTKAARVFLLTHQGSCHTVIFANVLRLDLDLGSVVLDTCVVPLTYDILQDMYESLSELSKRDTCRINLSKRESVIWKRLIPALVERCRSWPHKKSCEYQKKGGVAPLSTEEHETPLCSCGEGKDLPPDFAKGDDAWWAPFARYATRMAVAPIFPVPYVEPSMSDLIDPAKRSRRSAGTVPARAAATPIAEAGSSISMVEKCDSCGNTNGPFKKCARCGKTRYCNHACQKADWKQHKKICEEVGLDK